MLYVPIRIIEAIFNIKKENRPKISHICSQGTFSYGINIKFETAVVNEPSAFERLKFYCTFMFPSNNVYGECSLKTNHNFYILQVVIYGIV